MNQLGVTVPAGEPEEVWEDESTQRSKHETCLGRDGAADDCVAMRTDEGEAIKRGNQIRRRTGGVRVGCNLIYVLEPAPEAWPVCQLDPHTRCRLPRKRGNMKYSCFNHQ